MSLANRAKDIVPADRRKAGCPFGRTIRSLDDSERVAFEELVTKVASYTELSAILHEEGVRHERSTMIRHLKGECSCDPE